ncbi:MAG: glutathione synthase [Kistimonas sp.]|nr:glutathione synthase [Kistimonas sp.]
MSIRLAIVMDPLAGINFEKDTSLALLLAAQRRGWHLFYMEQGDLFQEKGCAMGDMAPLQVRPDSGDWFSLGPREARKLADMDTILMRKDPPVDREFLYSTYILEQAEREGVLVVNRAASLRDCNEKHFATLFPECSPPSLISRNMNRLRDFLHKENDVVYKPLDGMGGASVFRVRKGDPNLGVILETLTNHGQRQIIAQVFIPDITRGDKRILLVDGEPSPWALARVPQKGEHRGNLAAGALGVSQPLSERDLWISRQVGPVVREKGLLFVGLDVIGDWLTEVNVTSPTGLRQLEQERDDDSAERLMDVIAAQLKRPRRHREAGAERKIP